MARCEPSFRWWVCRPTRMASTSKARSSNSWALVFKAVRCHRAPIHASPMHKPPHRGIALGLMRGTLVRPSCRQRSKMTKTKAAQLVRTLRDFGPDRVVSPLRL